MPETSGGPLMQVAMERDVTVDVAALGVTLLPSPAGQAPEIMRLKRRLDRTHRERDVQKTIGLFVEVPR